MSRIFRRHHTSRFGDLFGDMISDGISTLQRSIPSGAITNIGGAVAQMQAAGNAAVASVGPAIDSLSGGNADVMKITQWAWSKNGELAGINSSESATADDLQAARAAVQQMLDWYGQASRLALSLKPQAPAAAPAATPAYRPVTTAPTSITKVPAPKAPVPASMLPTGIEVASAGLGGAMGMTVGILVGRKMMIAAFGPVGLFVGLVAGFGVAKLLRK